MKEQKCHRRECRLPLYAGNIKVVRRKGHRAYKVHRVCPKGSVDGKHVLKPIVDLKPKEVEPYVNIKVVEYPVTRERFLMPPPLAYSSHRFFIQTDRVNALMRAAGGGQHRCYTEIRCVPADLPEREPESFKGWAEIEVRG